MKNRINVTTNILIIYLLLVQSINCGDKILSIFYKDKYLLFKPLEDVIEVYENMMIPYMTYIENVFIPVPKGNISKIILNNKTGMVEMITEDGIKWIYERFKLRYKRVPSVIKPKKKSLKL